MNEFWAAIAGAIVGGLIAFGIQVIALREARKERIRDAAEKQKALGHALIFKVIGIYSHLRQLNLHLQDAAARMPKGTDQLAGRTSNREQPRSRPFHNR